MTDRNTTTELDFMRQIQETKDQLAALPADFAERERLRAKLDTLDKQFSAFVADSYAAERATASAERDAAEAKQRAADEAKLESQLKAAARARWQGTAETFERLWTSQMRDAALTAHMRDEKAKAEREVAEYIRRLF